MDLEKRIEELEKRVAELEGHQERYDEIELTVKLDNEAVSKQIIKSISDYQKRCSHITLSI